MPFWTPSQRSLEKRRKFYLSLNRKGEAYCVFVHGLLLTGGLVFVLPPLVDFLIYRDSAKLRTSFGIGSLAGSLVIGLFAGLYLWVECGRFLKSSKGMPLYEQLPKT
jgi:hypothetical protein